MQFPSKIHQIYTDFTEIHIDKSGGGYNEIQLFNSQNKTGKHSLQNLRILFFIQL